MKSFVCISYLLEQCPLQFRYDESLRNSFPDDVERVLFLRMLYQLLLHGRWPWKRPKMVLTGPPNSGKTSWLEPILAVLDRRFLATCTDEKKFSCQSITEQTQLIWLDEWQPGKFHFTLFINLVVTSRFHASRTILSCQLLHVLKKLICMVSSPNSFILETKKVNEYKRLFQGGQQFFPVKYGGPVNINFNSGIYVTCNEVSKLWGTVIS